MKKFFLPICAVLLVLGSILPLAAGELSAHPHLLPSSCAGNAPRMHRRMPCPRQEYVRLSRQPVSWRTEGTGRCRRF